MSRQLEAYQEKLTAKKHLKILEAVEGGLEEAVGRAGGQMTGFAARNRGDGWLLVIKAEFPAGPQVAFVGAEDLGSALVKATREANRDMCRWREDQYVGPG